MNLKNMSCIMICAAALFGVTGFFYSSAGGSDAVYVNQYPVYAGDTVTATINLGGVEKTLSGYNGVFVYDNDVFDVTEVVTEYGNTLWSTEVEDEVRFINVDSLEGIDISESAEILKVVLTVKETDVESINLGYKFNEIYSYDKETKLDTPMTDYKDLNITSMTLTFKSNQPEETETPVDENTQDETEGDVPEDNNQEGTEGDVPEDNNQEGTEGDVPEDNNQEGTEGDVPEDDNQEGTEGDVPENNSGDKNNAVTTDTPVPTKEASNSNNNESQNSTPTKVPQVNVSTEKPKVNVNSGTTSNSSSGSSTGGTATGGTATGSNSSGSSSSSSSSNSSSSSSSNNDVSSDIPTTDDITETPSITIDDEGSVLSDNAGISSESIDSTASTGDKTDLKSTILMGLASLLGCGGVGGLILSTKKRY